MRIIVDTAHPANVHYFKNFIFEMKKRGHSIFITARNKDISFKLLKDYGLDYYDMGTGIIGKGIIGKILYVIYAVFLMLKQFIKFKPEIVISFSSSYAAHACFLYRIPHITFEDTEHAKANILLYKFFSDMIITPNSFYENLGKNHFRMNSFMELFYLHKNRFIADNSNLKKLGFDLSKPFVLFRFVSWQAFHDIGQKGLSLSDKVELIKYCSKFYNVYISSESDDLPDEIKKYNLAIPATEIHNVLYFASIYIGEGGTMASESAVLGTPAIYINSLPLMGYLQNAKSNNLLFHLSDYDEIVNCIDKIRNTDLKEIDRNLSKFLENKIDSTAFLIWLTENYPNSKKLLIKDIEYMNKFR